VHPIHRIELFSNIKGLGQFVLNLGEKKSKSCR